MKVFSLSALLGIIALVFMSSCTDGLKEDKKQTLYVVSNDSTVIVYLHESKTPIVLHKPLTLDELSKYGIPPTVVEDNKAKGGMVRYVDGKENDVYEVSAGTYIFVIILFIIIMILGGK